VNYKSIDELFVVELSIKLALRVERLVRPEITDFSAIEKQNLLSELNRAETMCDDEHRFVRHQLFECFLHHPFALGIKSRGRFIKNQNRRVFQKSARNRNPLFLAT